MKRKFYYDDKKVTYESIVNPLIKQNKEIEEKAKSNANEKMRSLLYSEARGRPYIFTISDNSYDYLISALSYFYGKYFNVDYSYRQYTFNRDYDRHYYDAGEEVTEYSDGTIDRKTITDYIDIKYVVIDDEKVVKKSIYGALVIAKNSEAVQKRDYFIKCAEFLYKFRYEILGDGKTKNLLGKCQACKTFSVFSFVFGMLFALSFLSTVLISRADVVGDYKTFLLLPICLLPSLVFIFQSLFISFGTYIVSKSYGTKRFLFGVVFILLQLIYSVVSMGLGIYYLKTGNILFNNYLIIALVLLGFTFFTCMYEVLAIDKSIFNYIIRKERGINEFNANGGHEAARRYYKDLSDNFYINIQ